MLFAVILKTGVKSMQLARFAVAFTVDSPLVDVYQSGAASRISNSQTARHEYLLTAHIRRINNYSQHRAVALCLSTG